MRYFDGGGLRDIGGAIGGGVERVAVHTCPPGLFTRPLGSLGWSFSNYWGAHTELPRHCASELLESSHLVELQLELFKQANLVVPLSEILS